MRCIMARHVPTPRAPRAAHVVWAHASREGWAHAERGLGLCAAL